MKKNIFSIAKCIAIASIVISCTKSSVSPIAPIPSCIEVSLNSAAGSDSQTVVINTPITPISYSISNTAGLDTASLNLVSVAVAGHLPSGLTSSFSGGVLTISGTPTTAVGSPFVYTITTTGNTCKTVKGVIKVGTCATITLTSAEYLDRVQVVSIDSPIVPITYAIGNGGTGATVTGLPHGITGSFSRGVFTISGAADTATGSAYLPYTVTTTGGICSSTATGQMRITNDSARVTLTSAIGTDEQHVVLGTPIIPITYKVSSSVTYLNMIGFDFDYGSDSVAIVPGVMARYNSTTKIITISGTPEGEPVDDNAADYSISVSNSTNGQVVYGELLFF
ncbi:MAG TPA: hypothetical protein VK559_04305 [Ferruginibacter sp.]|nr:hypothetical protein [Ferruginibacter sp.]